MGIRYVVTHCYRKDYDDERWEVLASFDKVEDAVAYEDEQSLYIEYGFLFTIVEWSE